MKLNHKILLLLVVLLAPVYSQNTVTKVYDGDTFQIETGEIIRLIGIDAPEKKKSNKLKKDSKRSNKDQEVIIKLGKLSSNYAETILLFKNVYLIIDSLNINEDKYGRLLRYVYLEDGTFFNLKIIQDGFAFAYIKYPFIYSAEFLEAEKNAAELKTGLWGDKDFNDIK